jgi:hypothetical protein
MVPSKRGFVYDSFGLKWRLLAFRLSFSKFIPLKDKVEGKLTQKADIRKDSTSRGRILIYHQM